MTLTVDFWWLVGFGITEVGAFFALAKMIFSATTQRLDERFERMHAHLSEMHASHKASTDELRRIDRELMALRAELPEKYVRREDHNKDIASIFVRIDSLSLKLDNIFLMEKNK